jgi:hypothetical protein
MSERSDGLRRLRFTRVFFVLIWIRVCTAMALMGRVSQNRIRCEMELLTSGPTAPSEAQETEGI